MSSISEIVKELETRTMEFSRQNCRKVDFIYGINANLTTSSVESEIYSYRGNEQVYTLVITGFGKPKKQPTSVTHKTRRITWNFIEPEIFKIRLEYLAGYFVELNFENSYVDGTYLPQEFGETYDVYLKVAAGITSLDDGLHQANMLAINWLRRHWAFNFAAENMIRPLHEVISRLERSTRSEGSENDNPSYTGMKSRLSSALNEFEYLRTAMTDDSCAGIRTVDSVASLLLADIARIVGVNSDFTDKYPFAVMRGKLLNSKRLPEKLYGVLRPRLKELPGMEEAMFETAKHIDVSRQPCTYCLEASIRRNTMNHLRIYNAQFTKAE